MAVWRCSRKDKRTERKHGAARTKAFRKKRSDNYLNNRFSAVFLLFVATSWRASLVYYRFCFHCRSIWLSLGKRRKLMTLDDAKNCEIKSEIVLELSSRYAPPHGSGGRENLKFLRSHGRRQKVFMKFNIILNKTLLESANSSYGTRACFSAGVWGGENNLCIKLSIPLQKILNSRKISSQIIMKEEEYIEGGKW